MTTVLSIYAYTSVRRGEGWDGRSYVGFGCADLELDDGNFSLFHPCRSSSSVHDVLVQDDTLDKLGILNGSSDFLDDTDVAEIDVGGGRGD